MSGDNKCLRCGELGKPDGACSPWCRDVVEATQERDALRAEVERLRSENEQLRRRMRPYRNSIDVSGDCLIEGEGEAR